MTYTGQVKYWTEIARSARTKISMDNDLHRSSKILDRDREERQDEDLDGR